MQISPINLLYINQVFVGQSFVKLYVNYSEVKIMFVLNDIEVLSDDLQNLPDNMQHKLSFKLIFTIKGVPDSFTGIVFENAEGELQLQHFNNPKGNKRKVITLKNKLAKGSFEQIKLVLFSKSRNEPVSYPQELAIVQRKVSGTPRAGTLKKWILPPIKPHITISIVNFWLYQQRVGLITP